MTISTTDTVVTAGGTGSRTVFAFDFATPNSGDITAYLNTSGVITQIPPNEIDVTLNQPPVGGLWSIGGSLQYPLTGSPIAIGATITMQRVLPLTQVTSLDNQGNQYPAAIEAALDTLEMQIQQVNAPIARSIQFPVVDSPSLNAILPAAEERAGQFAAFDVNGNVIAAMPGGSGGIPISAAMQPVVEAATTAEALTLLGGASAPIANDSLATMAANTVKVNATASVATPTDLALSNNTLLGMGSTGNIAPITIGSGLEFTGDVLNISSSMAIGPAGASAYTTPGAVVFTTPSGSTSNTTYRITITAGGGAGGGSNGGSGGGAGATAIWWISGLSAGTEFNIIVGSGGVGGPLNGGNGSNSSVTIGSQTVTAFAGFGGLGNWNNNGGIGGPGASSTGAVPDYIQFRGGGGATGVAQGNAACSGVGGASYWGGGAPSVGGNTAGAGFSSIVFGSGGSGAYSGTGQSGGNGSPGIVLIEYGSPGSSGGSSLPPALIGAVSALTISGGAFATNAALGNTFYLQLVSGSTVASAPTGATDGQIITYELKQPSSGAAGTVSWNSIFDFGALGAPTLSTTNGLTDIIAFRYSIRVGKWLCLNGTGLGF